VLHKAKFENNITGKANTKPPKNETFKAVINVSCISIATIWEPSGNTLFTGIIISSNIGS